MDAHLCPNCATCGKPVQLSARAQAVKEVGRVVHAVAHVSRSIKNFILTWRAERDEMMRAHKRLAQMDRAQWGELVKLPASDHVAVYLYILKTVLRLNDNGPLSCSGDLATFYTELYNRVKSADKQRQPVWAGHGTVTQPYQFAPVVETAERWVQDYLHVQKTGTKEFSTEEGSHSYKNEYMRTYESRYAL